MSLLVTDVLTSQYKNSLFVGVKSEMGESEARQIRGFQFVLKVELKKLRT